MGKPLQQTYQQNTNMNLNLARSMTVISLLKIWEILATFLHINCLIHMKT